MTKNKHVTMQHVAQLARVSVATVSRVINHRAQTSPQMQRKVFAAIEKLNYDTTARIKCDYPSLPNKKILVIDNQFLSRGLINKGIEDTAKKEGYKLFYLRFLFFTEDEIQQIITCILNHHIDGILIINDSPYLTKLAHYQNTLPPIVLLNHYSRAMSCLYFDHLTIAFEATEYLLRRGHTHIACLVGLPNKRCTDQLIEGYQLACKRHSVLPQSEYIRINCIHGESAKQQLGRLLQLPIPPTAIFCHGSVSLNYTDEECFSAFPDTNVTAYLDENSLLKTLLWQAKKRRCQIPGDLSIITTTGQPCHEMAPHHTVTHIHMPMYQMGQHGFQNLINRIAQQNKQYQSIIMNSRLIERHSVYTKNPIV